MNKISDKIRKINNCERNFYLLWGCTFLLAFIPNIFLFVYTTITLKSFFYLFLSLAFCLFPALFLKTKVYFCIYFPFVLLAPVEIGHILANNVSLTSGFFLTIFNTNWGEIMSYLSSMWLLVLLSVVYWIAYILLWIKIPNRQLFNKKCRKIGFCFYILLFAGITALSAFSYFKSGLKSTFCQSVLFGIQAKLEVYPFSICMKASDAVKERRILQERYKEIEKFKFDAVVKNDPEKEIYVFFTGESARYSNFGINGYTRNTTPLLNKLYQEGNLLTFSEVYASGNLTSNVIPLLFTRATASQREIANREKSLITLCKEAGFKTYVLSNQDQNELFIRQIGMEADYAYLTNNDYKFDEKYDGLLLPHLDSILNGNENKICIFFFTQGSHVKYNHRYPKEFEKFEPAIGKTNYAYELSLKNKDLLVNAYDNSILYTDYILCHIVSEIQKQDCKSAFLYISDHGENIFDTPESGFGHGTLTPTKFELHIPFFIWLSDKYKNVNNKTYEILSNNQNKKINSSNAFYTFSNIAGIEYPLYEGEKDFSSEMFVPDSVLWVLNPDLNVLEIEF